MLTPEQVRNSYCSTCSGLYFDAAVNRQNCENYICAYVPVECVKCQPHKSKAVLERAGLVYYKLWIDAGYYKTLLSNVQTYENKESEKYHSTVAANLRTNMGKFTTPYDTFLINLFPICMNNMKRTLDLEGRLVFGVPEAIQEKGVISIRMSGGSKTALVFQFLSYLLAGGILPGGVMLAVLSSGVSTVWSNLAATVFSFAFGALCSRLNFCYHPSRLVWWCSEIKYEMNTCVKSVTKSMPIIKEPVMEVVPHAEIDETIKSQDDGGHNLKDGVQNDEGRLQLETSKYVVIGPNFAAGHHFDVDNPDNVRAACNKRLKPNFSYQPNSEVAKNYQECYAYIRKMWFNQTNVKLVMESLFEDHGGDWLLSKLPSKMSVAEFYQRISENFENPISSKPIDAFLKTELIAALKAYLKHDHSALEKEGV